jgi:hypothetical protein
MKKPGKKWLQREEETRGRGSHLSRGESVGETSAVSNGTERVKE